MSSNPRPNEASGLYHERQRLELCAVHALNNVLQERLFTQEAADEICKRLAPDARWNPHRSFLGTGNYDVNVIMAALQSVGLEAIWWDKRRPLEQLSLAGVFGFIINVPSNVCLGFLSLPVRRRHWIAVRQHEDIYYNLDSKLKAPAPIGSEADLSHYAKTGTCIQVKKPGGSLWGTYLRDIPSGGAISGPLRVAAGCATGDGTSWELTEHRQVIRGTQDFTWALV